jgi:hypothetical protein
VSALEQEIIDCVRKMDEAQKARLLAPIEDMEMPKMALGEWLEMATAFQEKLVAKYGANYIFDSESVLNKIREERLDDIMGSR